MSQGVQLPPPGESPGDVIEYLSRLVTESIDDPRREAWISEAERNFDLYLGNHWTSATPDGEIRVILNRTQNAIVSLVSLQAGEPPKIEFVPRETSDPPLYYLNTDLPQAAQIMLMFPVDPTTNMPIDYTQPLPDVVGENLKIMLEEQRMMAAQEMATGMPPSQPPPPEDLLIEVTDSTAAQWLQLVFDATVEKCDFIATYTESVLNKNILGWQCTLVEFDDEEKKHVLTNVHPKQIFPDPLNTDNKRWAWCVFDQPIGTYEAARKYPQFAAQIMDAGNRGTLIYPGGKTYDPASMFNMHFQRDMVVLRTGWIRHQRYPMSPEQALQEGKVIQGQLPSGETMTVEHVDEMGNAVPTEMPMMKDALLYPETGLEAVPGTAEWPMRYGIRQIIVIAGTTEAVLEDRECEYPEIPLSVNKNISIPFSTYGQGEPKRLEGLQVAVNRILSSFVTYHAYNAFPPEIVAESVVEMMSPEMKDGRTRAGQRITIPDHLLIQLGTPEKIITNMPSGQMASDFWRLLDLLVQYIDMEGNQADVIQGDAAAGWSGKTVDALQTAANQVIRGKAIYTEFYLKSMACLMTYNIIHRLTAKDTKRIASKFPVQVHDAFLNKLKALDVDISVEIASGSGASKKAETANLIAARQNGVFVPDPVLMERIGLDPDGALQQQADWEKKRGQLAGPVPIEQEGESSGSGKPEENGKQRKAGSNSVTQQSNGNGSPASRGS